MGTGLFNTGPNPPVGAAPPGTPMKAAKAPTPTKAAIQGMAIQSIPPVDNPLLLFGVYLGPSVSVSGTVALAVVSTTVVVPASVSDTESVPASR